MKKRGRLSRFFHLVIGAPLTLFIVLLTLFYFFYAKPRTEGKLFFVIEKEGSIKEIRGVENASAVLKRIAQLKGKSAEVERTDTFPQYCAWVVKSPSGKKLWGLCLAGDKKVLAQATKEGVLLYVLE